MKATPLLSNAPFIHIDTSSQISTGILWDRIVPNLYLPAFAGNNEDTAAWGSIARLTAPKNEVLL